MAALKNAHDVLPMFGRNPGQTRTMRTFASLCRFYVSVCGVDNVNCGTFRGHVSVLLAYQNELLSHHGAEWYLDASLLYIRLFGDEIRL